ncbi:hypothetical protein Hjap01_04071 [Haloarcula japonica]
MLVFGNIGDWVERITREGVFERGNTMALERYWGWLPG